MYQNNDSRSWNQTTCTSCTPVYDPCATTNANYQLVVEPVCAECQSLSRVRTLDKLTGAVVGVDQFYNSTGTLVPTPANFSLGVCQNQVITQHFKVLQAGAGTSVNDLVFSVQTICQPGNKVLLESWFNKTTGGLVIPKPVTGTIQYQPQGDQNATLVRETYTGADQGLNGVNKYFTTSAAFEPGTLLVYLDGQLQSSLGDYQENTTVGFTLTDAPVADQIIQVVYALLGTDLPSALPVYNAGAGIAKSGTTFSVKPASSRIAVTGSGVDLSPSGVLAGTYTSATITVDTFGRVLTATATPVSSTIDYLAIYQASKPTVTP